MAAHGERIIRYRPILKTKRVLKFTYFFADKRYIRYFVAILKGSTAAIQMPGLHNETITVIELICLCLTGQHFN